MRKKCSDCGKNRQFRFFTFKDKKKGILQSKCKDCQKIYRRKHYLANQTKYVKLARKKTLEIRNRTQKNYLEYLKNKECFDCGEKDVMVLEPDHVRGNKKFNLSKMIKDIHKWESILEELEKCEIRCANCHTRKTHKENNSYRYKFLKGQ